MDLPLPDRPRQRHHLARRDGEREAVQHVGAAAVAARDVLEDDLAAHGAEGDGARGVLHLDRFVEQLVHAPERHARGAEPRVEPHQTLDRADQADLVGHERGEGPERHRPVDHARTAVEEHHGGAGRQQDARQAPGQVAQPLHLHQRGHEGVVQKAEAPRLAFARVGGGHQAHPAQRLDEEGADARAPLAHDAHAHHEAAAVDDDRPDRGRKQRGGGQEETPVEPEQHPHRARQEGRVAEPGQRRVREHPLNFAHIVVES